MTPREPAQATQCPLCQQDNHCGHLNGAQQCWCFDQHIAAQILSRAPTSQQCLCPSCAQTPSPCASTDC